MLINNIRINRHCLEQVALQLINIINAWQIVEFHKIMDWKAHATVNPQRVINEIVEVLKTVKERAN